MKNKTVLMLALSAFFTLGLVSCGEGGEETSSSTSLSSSTSETKTYIVHFANTDISDVEYEEGASVNKPSDPYLNGYVFDGWYFDDDYKTLVTFPFIIEKNTTIYAKFVENKEYFLLAREKTLSESYKYSDTLEVTTTIMGDQGIAGPSANRKGDVTCLQNGDPSYLAHYISSGALLFDGEEYIIYNGGQRQNLKLNEDGKITHYEAEPNENKGDTSAFAKAIFEYQEKDIESVTETTRGMFEIRPTASITEVISGALTLLNNPLIQNIVDKLPETDNDYSMSVTYEDGYIDTFEYSFEIDVEMIGSVTFDYTIDFEAHGNIENITVPSFDGIYISTEDKAAALSSILADTKKYKSNEYSSYSYSVETLVDDGSSTYEFSQSGDTIRTVKDEDVYFKNHLDVKTNLNEYYDDKEIENYDVYRANIADGSTYSCVDNLIFSDELTLSTNRGEVDTYLLFPQDEYLVASNFIAIQVEENKEETSTVLLMNETGVDKYMKFLQNSLYVQIDSNSISPLGDYVADSIDIEEAYMSFNYIRQELSAVEVNIKGIFDTEYDIFCEDSEFDITLSLTIEEVDGYTIPETAEDIL